MTLKEVCVNIAIEEELINNLVYVGITDAGNSEKSNQDSLLCNRRFLPDTIHNFEEITNQSDAGWQVYAVTDGMGGSGIGDIAGRLAQELLIKQVNELQQIDQSDFDFVKFIQDYLDSADRVLQKRLAKYKGKPVGCSLALLLVCGHVAYTMSVGSNSIYMLRNDKLYRMTRESELADKGNRPLVFLGNHPGIRRLKAHNLNRIELEPKDKIVLLTDGMSIKEEQLEAILTNNEQELTEQLAEVYRQAQKRNPLDNKSIITLEVDGILPGKTVRALLTGADPEKAVCDLNNKIETDPFAPQSDKTDLNGVEESSVTLHGQSKVIMSPNSDETNADNLIKSYDYPELQRAAVIDDFPRIADTDRMSSEQYLQGQAYDLDVYDDDFVPSLAEYYSRKPINGWLLFLESLGIGALIGLALVLAFYFFFW